METRTSPNAPGGVALSVEERKFSYQIATLASLLDRHSARVLAPFGLSVVDWRIVKNLYESGPSAVGGLCPAVVVDKSLISRRVLVLAQQGLIQCGADEGDARKTIVALTPAGKALYWKVLPVSDRRQAALEGLLEPAQQESLYLALRRLRDFLADDLERQSRELRRKRSADRNSRLRKGSKRGA